MPSNEWVVYDSKSLGRAISYFRREGDMTQADLAELAGLHRPYVSRIERGLTTAHTARVFRLLGRLGLEIVVRRRRGS